jgi:hypothetical protein
MSAETHRPDSPASALGPSATRSLTGRGPRVARGARRLLQHRPRTTEIVRF